MYSNTIHVLLEIDQQMSTRNKQSSWWWTETFQTLMNIIMHSRVELLWEIKCKKGLPELFAFSSLEVLQLKKEQTENFSVSHQGRYTHLRMHTHTNGQGRDTFWVWNVILNFLQSKDQSAIDTEQQYAVKYGVLYCSHVHTNTK